jgi:hypothetical protein
LGRLRPGWASIDGGNEEFPLFRDTSRSSRCTFACNSAIAAACCAITSSRAAHPVHPAADGGGDVTNHHDRHTRRVIKPTR